MKIVIYGLSRTSFFVEKALRHEHTVVCYSDGVSQIDRYKNIPFIPADGLAGVDFDYLIIAVGSRKTSDTIREELENIYGINAKKIIDARGILNGQKVDNIMRLSNTQYSGIVLGNSHAAKAINSKCLIGSWCNLSNGSEDIYYHFVNLKICMERYWEKIKKLKYLIVDMWDYHRFNLDVSKSKNIGVYWSHGGIIEDTHNYDNNAIYHMSPDELLKEQGYYSPNVSERDKALAEKLFDFSVVKDKYDDLFGGTSYTFYNDYPSVHKFGKHLVWSDEFHMKYVEHRYEGTIQENKKVFDELIRLAKEINRNIKIIILLTPRMYKVEKIHSENVKILQWKHEFEEIVCPYVSDNVCFLNMKNLRSVSENENFYEDASHMNAIGANVYTSYLNDFILRWKN